MNLDELDVAALRLLRPRVGEVLQEKIDALLATPVAVAEAMQEPTRRRGVPNKTEARYMALAAVQYPGAVIEFERITLRLADGSRYTPDVFIRMPDGAIEFVEVKGAHIREAAIVRFKVARERFPFWTFRMMQWKQGRWRELYRQPDARLRSA